MIGVRTEASMDYFETDSNSSAPKRVPLSLRLPVQVVESVDRYASKTDAFLHFLRRGMDAERGELRLDQLVEIKEQLSEIKGMLLEKRGDRSEEAAFVREAVAQAASEFPAIERAYLFGSFARGTFGSDSDVDVRIEYDHGMSFNLHDVSQFGKRIEQATGREVDVVSTDRIKKEGLAAAIERDKELVYEREAR